MTHPCHLVWELAGRPDPYGAVLSHVTDHEAICKITGRVEPRTALAGKALGANFTDQKIYSRPDSDRVGVPAIWAVSGKGRETLRLWTIVAAPGMELSESQEKAFLQGRPGLCLTNRADTVPVIDILRDPPDGAWLVSIAVSAQKHVLPYSTTNKGRGAWTIRMENTDVTSTPEEFARVLSVAHKLRDAGHSAEHVLAGQPDMRAVKTPESLKAWAALADQITSYTHSPLLDLVLWCLTKKGHSHVSSIRLP